MLSLEWNQGRLDCMRRIRRVAAPVVNSYLNVRERVYEGIPPFAQTFASKMLKVRDESNFFISDDLLHSTKILRRMRR